MNVNYALPGMMPPSTPRKDTRVEVRRGDLLKRVLHTEDTALPLKPARFYIRIQNQDRYLRQDPGISVHAEEDLHSSKRQYVLQFTVSDLLPVGTHRAEVYIGTLFFSFYLTVLGSHEQRIEDVDSTYVTEDLL